MKILHIITTIERGGAEKQLLTLATQQALDKHQVFVLPLKGNLELKSQFEKNSVLVLTSLANLNWFKQVHLIRKFFKENHFDIVHAHLPRAELTAALSTKNKRFVATRHNAELFFPKSPKFFSTFLSRLVAKRACAVVSISKAVKDYLQAEGDIINESCVIHYGFLPFDDNNLTLIPKEAYLKNLGLGPEVKVISTISRLSYQKDIYTLLHAFKLVKDSIPNAHLLIAGVGKLEKKLKQFCRSLNLDSSVTWLGQIQNPSDLYNATDVFVLSSLYEGFGLVLLEAMQFEKPIVASNNTAIPEVIGHRHPGLAKTGDSYDFYQKILLMLSEETSNLAINMQNINLKNFDIKNTSNQYLGIYKKCRET